MKKLADFVLSLIYPDKCIFCGEIIPVDCEDKSVCGDCIKELGFYEQEETENFAAVFKYEGTVKEMIHRFKFRFHPEYAKRLAVFMEQRLRAFNAADYDFIAAVPMYYKKEKARGYNQAQLLADELSLRMGIKSVKNQLIRIKATRPQLELNHIQRMENVKNAFKIKDKGFFKNSRVILVDDIYTTGSTAQSCVSTLKDDGAREVFVFALSKTVSGGK